jgi:hypothetical protein
VSIILPDDPVTIHKVDAVRIPKLAHGVAHVMRFDGVARGLLGPWADRAGLVEVADGVASHSFISLVDMHILALNYGEVKQKKWRYNGDRAFMSMMQEGAVNRPE